MPSPSEKELIEAAKAAYDAVKEWPEKRGGPMEVGGEGFMNLLQLRNMVPDLIAALERTGIPGEGNSSLRIGSPSHVPSNGERPRGFYVASRASIPERPAMWRRWRERGLLITSTWIDEAGEGETADLAELWSRIWREVAASEGVILYAQPEDFPLKGALIECGIALGMGKPVAIMLDAVELEPRSLRPLGSWAKHPACRIVLNHPLLAVKFIREFNADRAEEARALDTRGEATPSPPV
jgi:hypothetical protein